MLPICEVDPRAGGWRRDPDVGIHHGWMGSVQAPWPSRLPSDRDLRSAHEEHRMVDVLTADRPERVATRIATHPTSGRGRSGPTSRVGADLGGPLPPRPVDPGTGVRSAQACAQRGRRLSRRDRRTAAERSLSNVHRWLPASPPSQRRRCFGCSRRCTNLWRRSTRLHLGFSGQILDPSRLPGKKRA